MAAVSKAGISQKNGAENPMLCTSMLTYVVPESRFWLFDCRRMMSMKKMAMKTNSATITGPKLVARSAARAPAVIEHSVKKVCRFFSSSFESMRCLGYN